MKFRGLVIAIVVLCALGGALYWSGRHKPSAQSSELVANHSPTILKVDKSAITTVALKKKGEEPITLERAGADKWRITAPGKYNADQDAVSAILSTLSSLDSQRVIEDKAANLQQYGLEEPAFEVDVTEKDRRTDKLDFGDPTPTGDAVYAMAEGNPKVFTTASSNESALDKNLNDLRDKRLLPVNAEKINRVELMKGQQDIVFDRAKNGWKISKPKPLRTDDFAVDDFVNQLAAATMDLSGTGSGGAERELTDAAPVAVARVTDGLGTQILRVWKNKDTYDAESSVLKGAYKVDTSLGEALGKNLDDFRNKTLFDFSFHQPNRIELHNGSKAWLFTWDGSDWWSGGKKMDADGMNSLVSYLRELTASKFVTSGFSKPEITVAVTSQSGNQVEQVLIAKSGQNYIAKRENETSLYALKAEDVAKLLQAAQNIKAVAPAAK